MWQRKTLEYEGDAITALGNLIHRPRPIQILGYLRMTRHSRRHHSKSTLRNALCAPGQRAPARTRGSKNTAIKNPTEAGFFNQGQALKSQLFAIFVLNHLGACRGQSRFRRWRIAVLGATLVPAGAACCLARGLACGEHVLGGQAKIRTSERTCATASTFTAAGRDLLLKGFALLQQFFVAVMVSGLIG